MRGVVFSLAGLLVAYALIMAGMIALFDSGWLDGVDLGWWVALWASAYALAACTGKASGEVRCRDN